ncbi:MAG: hypothetical protein JKY65_25025 [Planctomycetes bacterium]|nr:hypothetical protein [Planctomycetota bacterium]
MPSGEPETRKHEKIGLETRNLDELDTRDFDTRDVGPDVFPPNTDPDTVAHDEDAMEVGSAVEPDTVKRGAEPDTVTREGELEADELPTRWAPAEGEGESASILSDLPTLTYAGGAPPEAPSSGGLDTIRLPLRFPDWKGTRLRWLVGAGVLLGVIVIGVVVRQQWSTSSEERHRVELVAADVARIMTSSKLSLASEAGRALTLREDVDELQAAGADSEHLDEARAGLRAFEGLLALIRGNEREALQALADPELQNHARYHGVLEASVAACTSGSSPDALREVLAGGFVRPELLSWRAKARLRQLDTASAMGAEEALLELESLAAIAPLDSVARLQRLAALSTLGRWALARAELARLESAPPALAQRVALGELSEVVRGDPARARAWIDVHGLPADVDPLALRSLAERPLKESHALLQRLLGAVNHLDLDEQRDLLSRLQLAYRLGWSPLPRQILDYLRAVLQVALSRKLPVPGPCCLALATLGSSEDRQQVLLAVVLRIEEARTASGRLPLQSLLTTILVASPGTTPTADELLGPLSISSRAELRWARIAALLELERPRKALLAAQRALKSHPGDADLEELLKRAVAALRSGG